MAINRLVHRATAVAAAALLVAACSGSSGDDNSNSSPGAGITSSEAGTDGSAPAPEEAADAGDSETNIDAALAALDTAAGAVDHGKPYDMERSSLDGQDVWEIKVASGDEGHTVDVTSDGSSVVDQARRDDADDDVSKVNSAKVDAQRALRTVSGEIDGDLDEMEIDTDEDGTVVWKLEFIRSDGSEASATIYADRGDALD